MVYDNWDLNASDIDLKIDLYNKLIMQHKNDIKNLEDKIEKCCLQQMEINQVFTDVFGGAKYVCCQHKKTDDEPDVLESLRVV